jgi:hypothetical protein
MYPVSDVIEYFCLISALVLCVCCYLLSALDQRNLRSDYLKTLGTMDKPKGSKGLVRSTFAQACSSYMPTRLHVYSFQYILGTALREAVVNSSCLDGSYELQ